MDSRADYDVGIIGGGPAGSALGAYLAKAGLSCVIFERMKFPREHVGESLVPSSTRVLNELGFIPKMEANGFPRKYGAVWTSPRSNHPFNVSYKGIVYDGTGMSLDNASVRFAEREQPGVTQDYTYHVDRGKFDQLLLGHAVELGAQVHESTSARDVDFRGEYPFMNVQSSGEIGAARQVKVRMVADASGRQTVLGRQLGLMIKDPVFDQFAVHSWFRDYDRGSVFVDEKFGDYIYVHFLPITNSWVWQIPITSDITSIGVVTQKKHFAASKKELDDFFWSNVGSRKELSDGLRKAEQLRPFKAEGDYSYAMKQICGDRFVLVGDAGRFVDPIFSTGVSIALNSARFASRDIIAAAAAGDFSKSRFATFESTIRRGTNNWYEFIKVYYRLNVLFTMFVNDPEYRLDVLRLLQGDVYDEDEPAILAHLREIVTTVEQNEKHGLHRFLGEVTGDAFRPAF
jgi:FADH2 O2-dependent halogenase